MSYSCKSVIMGELLSSNNFLFDYDENDNANSDMVKKKIKKYKAELLSSRDEDDPLMQGLPVSSISICVMSYKKILQAYTFMFKLLEPNVGKRLSANDALKDKVCSHLMQSHYVLTQGIRSFSGSVRKHRPLMNATWSLQMHSWVSLSRGHVGSWKRDARSCSGPLVQQKAYSLA